MPTAAYAATASTMTRSSKDAREPVTATATTTPATAEPATSSAADVAAMLAEPFGKATVQDRINDVVGVIREKMVLHRFRKLEGGVYGGYIHHDGTVGVLLECKGSAANDDVLKDVAAHIAALRSSPASISPLLSVRMSSISPTHSS